MKKFSVLFVLIALIATTGITKAQSTSALSGKTFVLIMKDDAGLGEEIMDNMTFSNKQVSSQNMSLFEFAVTSYTETLLPNGAQFSFTATSPNGASRTYSGTLEDQVIYGTIQVTDNNGQQSAMVFRGATEAAWRAMTGQTENAE